jgi:hypothetical protein
MFILMKFPSRPEGIKAVISLKTFSIVIHIYHRPSNNARV